MCDEVEEKSKIYKMIPMFSKKIMCIFKFKIKISCKYQFFNNGY